MSARWGWTPWQTALRWLTVVLVIASAVLAAPRPLAAQTSDGRVIGIRVDGTLRVEPSAVLGQVSTAVGDSPTPRGIGDDVRAIYALGFFDDIEVSVDDTGEGLILTFRVVEKPSVAGVEYIGADKLKEEDFADVVDLRTGSILDEGAVRHMADAIEGLYREKGYFLADVGYELAPAGEGRVTVRFVINEHARVRVRAVDIVGNDQMEDADILRYMQTRPGTLMSFLSGGAKFDMEKLSQDLQTLRVLYYDHGYIDVAVDDPVIEISRDRESIDVSIRVTEGEQYSVSSVSVSGDLLESQEDALARVQVEPGETFRSSRIREDIEATRAHYQDLGYAFANVDLLTSVHPESRTIDITYDLTRGDLVYIGRIRVVGNTSTRDRVVRRELAIEEGDLYSVTNINRSRQYLTQLGFFETVDFREVPSTLGENLIDLEIEVSERHTRSLQVGAGYSSLEGIIATAQVSENNLLGRGQSLTLNAMFSGSQRTFVLSLLEPRVAGSRVSMQVDVFNRQLAYVTFDRISRGGSVSLGYRPFDDHPYWRALTLFGGYSLEYVDLQNVTVNRSGSLYQDGLTSTLTSGVALDRRNDRTRPTRGYYLSLNNDISDRLWGSDFEFDRVRASGRSFWSPKLDCEPRGSTSSTSRVADGACRWVASSVLRLNLGWGYVGSTSRRGVVPASERFYPGGPTSVRGFDVFTLGPQSPVGTAASDPASRTGLQPIGGHRDLLLQLELEFPLINAVGIRGVLFADAGNAFGVRDPYSLRLDVMSSPDDDLVLRTDLGFGFRWQSPLGMLRFEFGYPLQVREGESRHVFQFGIGPSF
ncbi:MAG: outer membrane protein assembly factor BamA [Myxococcales bacterium]|nr:outer membrane protein assembly factor BamA [Myxococcales bacterium]MCB9520604.1 outer membrane protein assembly factor BamA [Myxococcales bacterium]MCB9531527.1 outer membrane protein assembly factor BamA [Myxococcales bacterium]